MQKNSNFENSEGVLYSKSGNMPLSESSGLAPLDTSEISSL